MLGDDCSGNTSDVIDALEWVARNHETYNIKVVNLSLGHAVLESIFTDPLVQAVERLSRKGIVVVTAAGNKGINPATGDAGLRRRRRAVQRAVGDLRRLARHAGHARAAPTIASPDSSSRGPTRFDLLAKPDLVAPGVNIVSLAAPGSRLFNEFEHLRVPGATGQPRILHAVGHQHGVAGGGRRRGAAASRESRALGQRAEDRRCSSPRGSCR